MLSSLIAQSSSLYVYSSSGELQKKITGSDTTNYTYDYFGNLITVILPNNDRIDYIIDGQNRRIGKKLNGQIVKKWIYSGQLSPSAELDSAGNVTAQFVGPLMIKNGHAYQLVTDHLGSVRIVVDVSSGDVVQKLDYDEYGNIISDSNPDFEPFGYAGGLYDSQTKLVRFGARDYDASIGRWTCKDPIGFGGGANQYIYVGNQPVNYVDKTGEREWSLSYGVSGTLFFFIGVQLSANAGITLNTDSWDFRLNDQFQIAPMIGVGIAAFAGQGPSGGTTAEKTAEGVTTSSALHVEGGLALGGGFTYALDIDPCENSISGSFDKTKAGKAEGAVGFAAYSAVGQSFTATLTTPSLGKMLNAVYNEVASWFK